MISRKTAIIVVIAMFLGFLAGREEMKYEIASAVSNAFAGIGKAFSPAVSPPVASATGSTPASIAQDRVALAAKQEAAAYGKSLKIYDFEAKYIKTYSGDHPAGVRFKIKNVGDRTVTEICVNVYYQDAAGKNVAEKRFCPVLASSFSLSNNSGPLKPNYVWQQENDSYYVNKEIPAEWKEGAATIEFESIELEQTKS